MTQREGSADEIAIERACQRIGRDRWSQCAWFVRLANVPSFDTLSADERVQWQQEFAVIQSLVEGASGLLPPPPRRSRRARLRYPGASPQAPSPPSPDLYRIRLDVYSPCAMERIREAVAQHVVRLADGEGTALGPFALQYLIMFDHVHDAYGKTGVPRYLRARGELHMSNDPPRDSMLRLLAKLLEEYADQVRRCPHCRKVFLQSRLNQEHCSRACQSVAIARAIRARNKAVKRRGRRASAKGGSARGKKRR